MDSLGDVMDFCNYNWNMANLSLHSTFDTLLRSKNRSQYIQITQQKLNNVASFSADWGSTKFNIHLCILSSVYFYFATEETIMIEFAR